jgi:hypothetical protein
LAVLVRDPGAAVVFSGPPIPCLEANSCMVAGPSHVDLRDNRSVVRFGPRGGGGVEAAGPIGCRHCAAVGGGGGLGHGAAVALVGGNESESTSNGRDLNVAQLNQILFDSLV